LIEVKASSFEWKRWLCNSKLAVAYYVMAVNLLDVRYDRIEKRAGNTRISRINLADSGQRTRIQFFPRIHMYVETPAAVQSLDGIAAQTPEWIQLITRPIGRLYDIAYVNGVTDAGL
jgi:hypothetical protein